MRRSASGGVAWLAAAAVVHALGWAAPALRLQAPLLHDESVRPLLWILSVGLLQVGLWRLWPSLKRPARYA